MAKKMTIYPGVDISDGQVVRLIRGDINNKKIYDPNPTDAAKRWESCGSEWIHVVDIDGAFTGTPVNTGVIALIKESTDLKIQLGGGIRCIEDIEMYFNMGIDRVVVGSSAMDRNFCEEILTKYGDKIVMDIGTRNGSLVVKGWAESVSIDPIDFAQRVKSIGAIRFVFTDANKDGTGLGPNLEALEFFAKSVDSSIIASGGVTTLDDIRKILALSNLGVDGIIIGRALYEKTLDLHEIIKVCGEMDEKEENKDSGILFPG